MWPSLLKVWASPQQITTTRRNVASSSTKICGRPKK
jgi:hypothetical protein